MKCFNHSEVEAVSICLGCGKAICRDCIHDDESAVVCSGACAERIKRQMATVDLIRQKTLTQNKVSGIFCIVAGLVFALFGLFHITRGNIFLPLSMFTITLGVGLLIGGAMFLRVAGTKA
jgi:hypothetical protein